MKTYNARLEMFEDNDGRILLAEEVDELGAWEIEERGIHVYNDWQNEVA